MKCCKVLFLKTSLTMNGHCDGRNQTILTIAFTIRTKSILNKPVKRRCAWPCPKDYHCLPRPLLQALVPRGPLLKKKKCSDATSKLALAAMVRAASIPTTSKLLRTMDPRAKVMVGQGRLETQREEHQTTLKRRQTKRRRKPRTLLMKKKRLNQQLINLATFRAQCKCKFGNSGSRKHDGPADHEVKAMSKAQAEKKKKPRKAKEAAHVVLRSFLCLPEVLQRRIPPPTSLPSPQHQSLAEL